MLLPEPLLPGHAKLPWFRSGRAQRGYSVCRARRAQDGEPSPLLPAWLELPLHPVRSQPSKGLKGGASPLLLPPAVAASKKRGAEGGDMGGSAGANGASSESSVLRGGVMPAAAVLQRSEFLLPLDAETDRLLGAALRPE